MATLAYLVAVAVFAVIGFAAWGSGEFRRLDKKSPAYGECPVCGTKN